MKPHLRRRAIGRRPAILLAGAAASLGGCATAGQPACSRMDGVTPRLYTHQGRSFVIGHDYRDEASRVAHLHCLAGEGSQDAQLELGRRYENGEGVEADQASAASYYRRAAVAVPASSPVYTPPVRQGESGQVVFLRNPQARRGSAEAQYRLGLMYWEGRGVERSERRAVSLIEEAAGQDHPGARQWLAQHRPDLSKGGDRR